MNGDGNSAAICVNQSWIKGSVPGCPGANTCRAASRPHPCRVVLQHLVKMPKASCSAKPSRDTAWQRRQARPHPRRQRTARRSRKRLIGIEQRVLNVRRIHIDLVRSEDLNLVLLKCKRGNGPAKDRRQCRDTSSRPVAHRAVGSVLAAWRRKHLLQRLHSIEDAGSRSRNHKRFMRLDSQHIASASIAASKRRLFFANTEFASGVPVRSSVTR